jgi:hypothetical protein
MLNDIQRFLPLLGTGISDQPTIDSRDEILRLMGPAKWHRDRADGSLGAEKWNVGPYFMHITWSGQTNHPTVISFGLQALEP